MTNRIVVTLAATCALGLACSVALEAEGVEEKRQKPLSVETADNHIFLKTDRMKFIKVSPTKHGSTGSDFYLLETEVTNRMYAQYLKETGRRKGDEGTLKLAEEQEASGVFNTGAPAYRIDHKELLWRGNSYPKKTDGHPVSLIKITDARRVCDWLSGRYPNLGTFRLPTMDEWLIAAYGKNRKCPWGNEWKTANVCFDSKSGRSSDGKPEDVKKRPAGKTPEGLFGMWGNVSEFIVSWEPQWLGGDYRDGRKSFTPNEDYWGYWHRTDSRSQTIGFRVLLSNKTKDDVKSLHMIRKEKQRQIDYENRFNDLPKEAREILRAHSLRGDSDMSTFKAAANKARRELNQNMINQLVGQIGLGNEYPYSVECHMVLENIFMVTDLMAKQPYFKSPKETAKAATVLAGAISHVKSQYAFEHLSKNLMAVADIDEMTFRVPELNLILNRKMDNKTPYSTSTETYTTINNRYTKADSKIDPRQWKSPDWEVGIEHVRKAFTAWWNAHPKSQK